MIKHLIKKYFKYFWVKDKLSPQVQIQQVQLLQHYQDCYRKGIKLDINQTGFKNFSQFEEDGLLLFVFSIIGMNNKEFVEIGSDDGINSNSANLYFHHGWHGLFLDANPKAIERGQYFYNKYPHPWYYQPRFECTKVYRENINELLSKNGFTGDIGLLSVDIDGNDYWIWDAITVISPEVVVMETHTEFGHHNIVVPYDKDNSLSSKHPIYHGASPIAMQKLGQKKGYKLIGANQLGFNFIFLRKDLDPDNYFPEKTIQEILTHKSLEAAFAKFEPIKDWVYETPIK